MPDSKEAIRIDILEIAMISPSGKASNVIKMDIVKPIPPRMPAPQQML